MHHYFYLWALFLGQGCLGLFRMAFPPSKLMLLYVCFNLSMMIHVFKKKHSSVTSIICKIVLNFQQIA